MVDKQLNIKIDQISRTLKKQTLLEPISHTVKSGQILALCGGNGAGKSTLIRLITGLTKPTTGKVTINGLSRTKNEKEFLTQIGYMPDDFQFQRSISAKETLNFYAKLKNIDARRVQSVLKRVGLADKQDRKVGTFSKGMKQRLLLAQALLANPNILILDEPTNGLDPFWVKELSKLMLQAKENGQIIIFSTHDLHVAEEVADEVIFLSDGKVISKGPVAQYADKGLYETFQSLYFKAN